MADNTFKPTDDDAFRSTDADEWLIDNNVVVGVQNLSWEIKGPAPTVVHLAEKQDLSWQQQAPAGYTVQAEPAKVELAWAIQQDTHEIKIDVAKQDLAWTIKSEVTPTAIVTPDKLEITHSLQSPSPVVKVLPDGQQLTWQLQAPSVSTSIGKTVTPSTLTLTWTQKAVQVSAGEVFKDTDADRFVDFHDRWAFKEGETTGVQVQVDKQVLTWSAPAPTVAYDKVVYPYSYLQNEAGFPVRDEAGEPIEIGKPVLEATWEVKQPSIIKNPEAVVTPNELKLTWTLQTPTIIPLQAVSVENQTLTWSLAEPTLVIYSDNTVTPAALTATWNVNRPRILGTARRSRSKGMLLGVYRRG